MKPSPFAWDEQDAPEAVRALPRDSRGLPIPWVAVVGTDGKPDFKAHDVTRWVACVKHRRCQICGTHMPYWLAFIGGPASIQSRLFTDPPMHPECARFAMKVCPMMAAPKFAYARATPAVQGHATAVNEAVSTERPEFFYLGLTRHMKAVLFQGSPVVQADSWHSTEKWKHGKKVSDAT